MIIMFLLPYSIYHSQALYEHWATALFSVTVDILRTPGTRLIKVWLITISLT